MNAVVKLGGYISRGVVTVSAPFHPFGGAVDIVVVEQEDGSFKSSPWYVQFGKFQGVLKAKEKVVSINVNGVDADLHMYLDSKGGAHFLREVDGDEEMFESVGSSGDDMDGSSSIRSPQKIVSCNFVGKDREGSLERAEIAADLLEVRWSTSLATRKHRKDNASCNSDPETSIHDDKGSTPGSLRTPKSNGFHDEGDAETPVSTGLANFMESFTLEETYLDPNATEISVGSNGDVQSSSFRVLQAVDDRRLERVDSIYCEASESFMDGLDDYSGESNENVCSGCTVSKKMDVPNVVLGNEPNLNSEFPSTILECEMGMDTEDLENRNHCRSIEGSKSDSVTVTDVETVYETKVEVVVQCNTNEGPVKYVEELIVDQISSNQEPSLSNSFVIEEATISLLNSIENLRSQNPSSRHSTGLFQMGLSENNESLVASMNECNRAAFQVHTTNSGVLEKTEGEQFLSSDLVSSGLQRIESMESTSNSITKESNSQDVGVSSEDEEDLSMEKPNETQFCISDLDGSEVTKTADTQLVTSDSLEAVNDLHYHPKSSEEKLGESTGISNESLSFSGHAIQETLHDDHPSSLEMSRSISSPISICRVHEQVDRTEHTVESLPSFWSHEAEVNRLGANLLISRSLDSSFDNMRFAQGDVPTTLQTGEQKQEPTPRHSSMKHMQISEELRKILSDSAVEISLCRHLLYEGMGHEAAAQVFDAEKLDLEKLVSLGSDIIRNDRLVVRIGRLYFPWDAALPIISAIGSPTGERILPPKGMIIVDQVDNGVETDPQLSTDSRNNTWTIWPFSKTKSTGRRPPLASTVSQRDKAGDTDTAKSESIKKKMAWTKTPTSEQLASLNLKEGRNEVTFTFSTPMLGEQKVDARIYLWKWNARIVISDVDGTITKSDVLGQFMPLVGVDWSHTGVAHLFSAIKENGYEVLFLSARAISQASLTRQFLFNLMQEGKALPEGPVIISPDGLFPSLYREVIRRAPHEFKIACLKDIRDLFPPDQNPFYAGFGNRDTDELSYLKMGIPQGKIFIINPKGEVAVQRRVDRKSYASLHTLVHDMFPPPSTVSASEQEDFNQWNFWRLPPPEDV